MRSRTVINALGLCLICSSHDGTLTELQFIEQEHILGAVLCHLHLLSHSQLSYLRQTLLPPF